jgi:hypothetical protein
MKVDDQLKQLGAAALNGSAEESVRIAMPVPEGAELTADGPLAIGPWGEMTPRAHALITRAGEMDKFRYWPAKHSVLTIEVKVDRVWIDGGAIYMRSNRLGSVWRLVSGTRADAALLEGWELPVRITREGNNARMTMPEFDFMWDFDCNSR